MTMWIWALSKSAVPAVAWKLCSHTVAATVPAGAWTCWLVRAQSVPGVGVAIAVP
ncbi:hypothetical protein [Streptomyces peucetius]